MDAFWISSSVPKEKATSDSGDRQPSHDTLRRQPTSEIGQGNQAQASGRVLQVLVVGGRHDTTHGLVRLVRGTGHLVRLAKGEFAALAAAAAEPPDVVLLDLDSPHSDACDFAKRLRLAARHNKCFVIAMTERADDERYRECLAAGINLVLIQPVDPSVVETLLLLERELVNRQPALQTDDNPSG